MQTHGRQRRGGLLARMGPRPFVVALMMVVSASLGVAEPAADIMAADQRQGKGGVGTEDFTAPGYKSTVVIVDNGPANPYGSTVNVSGLKGSIVDVNLSLINLSHGRPEDVSIELAHLGRASILMRDAGGVTSIANANILLDNDAPGGLLPNTGPLVGSTAYQPQDYQVPPTNFGGGAPNSNDAGQDYLDFFDDMSPNGNWTLWVRDDEANFTGSLGGWQLEIVTDDDLPDYIAVDSYKTKQKRTLRVSRSRGVLRSNDLPDTSGLEVFKETNPKKGKLTFNSDGSFVYRPKGKRKGRDRFEYRVEDEFGNVIIGSGLVKIKINKNKHLKKKHKHKHRRNRK